MSIRRPYLVMVLVLLSSATSHWHAQGVATDPPRALAYSASLLPGAFQTAMDVDVAGRIYLAGYICESRLPVTAGAAQSTYAGGCDGFVAILAPDRRLQYATYLGGAQQERITAIDVDEAGNVYVAGDTASADFPTTSGAYDVSWAGGLDVFVSKLTAAGNLAYSTLLGGLQYEQALGLAIDRSGRAHVAGYTGSVDFPTTPGALSGTHDLRDDAFYTRIDASGRTVSYSTFIGGSGSEGARAVAIDAEGAAYVTGGTDSSDLPTSMAFQPSAGGEGDGWLLKIGADRSVKYLTYFGGVRRETVNGISVHGGSVYLAGDTCSPDLPLAPSRAAECGAAYVTTIAGDGSVVTRTAILEGMASWAFAAGPGNRAYLVGYASPPLAPTPDAFQPSPGPFGSPAFVVLALGESPAAQVEYATYVGSGGPLPHTVRLDGSGGAYLGFTFIADPGFAAFPIVNAPFSSVQAGGAAVHFVPEARMVNNVAGEIVMYAEDATTVRGNWRLEADSSAALGRKLRNPNNGAAKLTRPLAAPTDYVEFRFHAEEGVRYRLWIRGRADNNNWANDSVFVQFSDSVDASGAPVWRIGSTSATEVNLEDCVNCRVRGWGWQDNGYGAGVLGPPVRFASTGMHTLRIQRREDGYAFDQVVLSSSRYLSTPPGPLKDASTVLARSNGQPASDVVLHMTGAQVHGAWRTEARADAASGTVVRHPDAGGAKVVRMPVPAVNYFELTFDAEAGRPYHLWLRGIAERNYWGNDSVHVQFSDSVDQSGTPRWRIGSTSSTEINLEDCSGCGLRGWGWQDNGWGVGVSGPRIYFESTGPHVIRVTTREDGLIIDQIVLSAATYLTASPGALKNDTTILVPTR
jgi:Beta-propeller repeat